MTEAEWLVATDPERMVWLARKRGTDRRHRLAACACYRAAWEAAGDRQFEWVIEVGERFADGDCDPAAARAAFDKAMDRAAPLVNVQSLYELTLDDLNMFSRMVGTALCANPLPNALGMLASQEPTRFQRIRKAIGDWLAPGTPEHREPGPPIWCHLLRDVFGNPFRPVGFDHAWRTSTAVALARRMYGARDFSPMPILADALQDAGCEDEGVLSHCRGDGPHVRGCWVVDSLLGKE